MKSLTKIIYDSISYILNSFVLIMLLLPMIAICNISIFNYAYAEKSTSQNKVDNLIKGFSFNYDQTNQEDNNKNPTSSITQSFGIVSLDGLVKDDTNKTNKANKNNSYYIGLHLNLNQGWHLYWISAGSAGLPPTIKLNQHDSINIQSAKISYPQPKRMITLGENISGYSGNVYLPLHILLKDSNKLSNTVLKIKTTIFICKEQCLRRDISLSVKISQLNNAKNIKNLALAIKKLPLSQPNKQNTIKAHYKITSKYKGLIYIEIPQNNNISDIFLHHRGLNIDKPTITHTPTSKLFTFKVNGIDMLKNNIDVYLTRNNSFYVIKNLAINQAVNHTNNIFLQGKIYYILLLSLLAGLILNVMPCVLPVLGLKILSITRTSHKPKILLLFMSLGMILTFTMLGLILLISKYMGLAVGWGMQFQSLTFTISMAILMIVLSLFMLFDLALLTKIPLFNKILNFFNQKIPLPTDTTSAFLNGFLATILATPCTAPFMGGVISYSLTMPLSIGFLIYTFLGIGMASPFLLASIYPNITSILSKLNKLHAKIFIIKRLLFIPMIATAIWLGLTAYDQIQIHNKTHTPFIHAIPQDPTIKWHAFEPNKIQALVKSGKTVFVDITADWCLTCKVNENLVLYTTQGKKLLFNTKNIYPMQADWTTPNQNITNYLEKNNRYSLPFYKVYTKQTPQGTLLPVILSQNILQKYLSP